MSRLIDADELLRNHGRIEILLKRSEDYNEGYFKAFNEADRLISVAPTVDAVEVVRCKDCVYGNKEEDAIIYPYKCDYVRYGDYNNAEHFCSYGERRTE